MVYVYGVLLVLGLLIFTGSILNLVESLGLQYYWLTVGFGMFIMSAIQVVRYKNGYTIKRPFMLSASALGVIAGYPMMIVSTHTRAEFFQYEYGHELVLLGVIFGFILLGFAGERDDTSTGWGNDNRTDLSKKIDER